METVQQNLEQLSLNQGLSLEVNSEISHLKHSVSHEILSLITIKAPSCETETTRLPIDLVAVLDQSGSMDGDKLRMVRNSMNFAISQLKSNDRLSVVLFESEVNLLFPLKEMDSKNKQEAIDLVNSVKALNLTNLSGGLTMGFNQLIEDQKNCQVERNSVSSILLFTDGLANKGLTKTEEIKNELIKMREELKKPSSIFCFGYGSDHSTEMLRGISDAGDGMYYYVEDEEKIPSAFGDCIGGLLSVAAQNLKLKLESHNGVQIKKILGAPVSGKNIQSNNASDTEVNGTSYEREMGDIYSEEERNIVCLLQVPSVEKALDDPQLILSCELTGFDVIKKDTISENFIISIIRGEETKMDKEKSIRIDVHRNRLITVQALTNSKILADKGHLDQGRNILLQAIHELKNSPSSDKALTLGLIGDLEETMRDMRDRSEYTSKGSKKMAMYSRSHACERAIHSKAMYSNKIKMMEKENYKRNVIPMGDEELQLTKALPLAPTRIGSEKILIVGNKYRKLDDSEKTTSSSSPNGFCEHEWTMFVSLPEFSNEKISDVVEKVKFILHHTFEPNEEEVVSEPFSITKKGWGMFQVKCEIYFHQKLNRSHETIYHQLVFDPKGSSINHKIIF